MTLSLVDFFLPAIAETAQLVDKTARTSILDVHENVDSIKKKARKKRRHLISSIPRFHRTWLFPFTELTHELLVGARGWLGQKSEEEGERQRPTVMGINFNVLLYERDRVSLLVFSCVRSPYFICSFFPLHSHGHTQTLSTQHIHSRKKKEGRQAIQAIQL